MKIWITRFALEHGIQTAEAEIYTGNRTKIATVNDGPYEGMCFSRGDWHQTEDAAKARLREILSAEIESLEKRLASLRRRRIDL